MQGLLVRALEVMYPSKPKYTMVPHLRDCTKVAPDVRQKAKDEVPKTSRRRSHVASPNRQHRTSREVHSPHTPARSTGTPAKRQKTGSHQSANSPKWPAKTQREFAEDMCRMLVSAGIPWNAANDPGFEQFFVKWLPNATLPDRRALAGHLLDKELERVEDRTRSKVEGRYATGQCDGWKNIAKQSLVATMVTVNNEVSAITLYAEAVVLILGQAHLMRTHDVSAEQKTGEFLWQLVTTDIQYSEDKFRIIIIAWCTDDGGDARKMRRLLKDQMPWLIIVLCWAHQIQLVIGDYLSLKDGTTECVKLALEVINWFNNHSRALGLLNSEQRATYGKVLALILPVITRWTAHYLSSRRLLEVSVAIRACVMKHKEKLINCSGPKADAKAKAESVMAIVECNRFWECLVE
jgi:hypothetical protein